MDADEPPPPAAQPEPERLSPEDVAAPEDAATPEVVAGPEDAAAPEAVVAPEVVAGPEDAATPEAVVAPEDVATPEVVVAPEAVATPEVVAEPEDAATPEAVVAPEDVAPPAEPAPGSEGSLAAADALAAAAPAAAALEVPDDPFAPLSPEEVAAAAARDVPEDPFAPLPAPVPESPPPAPPRRRAPISSRRLHERLEPPAPPAAPPPRGARLVGGGVLLLGLLLAGGVVLLGRVRQPDRPPPPGPAAPVASLQPATPEPPAETPERLAARVSTLAERGRYREALAACDALLALPDVPAPLAARLRAQRPGLSRALTFQEELEGALEEGPDSARLRALVVRIERGEVEEALLELPLVARWKARARATLGADAYGVLVMFGAEQEEPADPAAVASQQEALDELARAGAERVERARRQLAEADAASVARVRSEALQALADGRPLTLPPHRGRAGGQGRLVAYDAQGFSLALDGAGLRRFTWRDAPAALSCEVLARALDLRDPEARLRIARAAARGGLFQRVDVELAAVEELDPRRELPPLASLAAQALLHHAEGSLGEAEAALRYDFARQEQLEDFSQGGWGWAEVDSRSLHVACVSTDSSTRSTWLAHEVEFGRGFEAELQLAPVHSGVHPGELLVGVASGVAALSSAGLGHGSWKEVGAAPRDQAGAFDPARPLTLHVTRPQPDGPALRLVVRQGQRTLVDATHTEGWWPAHLELGARAGGVRVAWIRLRGVPDPQWLERARDLREFRLEVAVDALERERREGRERRAVPLELRPTRADELAAGAGVPLTARRELERARMWLELGLYGMALGHVREAVSRSRRFWAAEYLLAQLELLTARSLHESSLVGPRLRLDRAIEGVPGFAEALAARARLRRWEGRLELARADVEAALAARPDWAPARLELAWVLVQEDRLDEAVEEARLAAALAEDQGSLAAQAREIQALRDGPPWPEPVQRESEHYLLLTDLPGRADEVLAALEAVRREAPRLFPSLRARPGARARKARVLFFSRAEDYHRHAYRTGGSRKEETGGYFDPQSGHLYVFESRRRRGTSTLWKIRHEATHQWVHSLGLELPYWANEAIADYVGGWDERQGRSHPDRDRVRALTAEGVQLIPLFELMTMSPSEFYSGQQFLHYAEAWSFVHHCLEGGDARLSRTLHEYLERHCHGEAGSRARQEGVSLEHIYADTFHQLDRRQLESGWLAHVQRLAAAVEAAAASER